MTCGGQDEVVECKGCGVLLLVVRSGGEAECGVEVVVVVGGAGHK